MFYENYYENIMWVFTSALYFLRPERPCMQLEIKPKNETLIKSFSIIDNITWPKGKFDYGEGQS